MLDRFERPLRMLCLALVAVVLFQFVRLALRGDPLAHLNIPQVPTLAGATNAPDGDAMKPMAVVTQTPETNAPGTNGAATNLVHTTNQSVGGGKTNGMSATNGTNMTHGTNLVAGGANAAISAHKVSPKPARLNGRPGGPGKVDLPPAVQSRVDTITDSEILGPVMHPQPMALIGISEDRALIRSTSGQTDWVKVDGEMGGIKLLRIGMNRVLVAQDGETNELSLFGGIGGESLMPKPAETPATNSTIQTNKAVAPKAKETH